MTGKGRPGCRQTGGLGRRSGRPAGPQRGQAGHPVLSGGQSEAYAAQVAEPLRLHPRLLRGPEYNSVGPWGPAETHVSGPPPPTGFSGRVLATNILAARCKREEGVPTAGQWAVLVWGPQ